MITTFEKYLRKHWYILAVVGIVLVAAFLRFYKIGQVPHGLTWDEAAIGYNGYAVVTTRRDEWLTRLPLSFRSFGDYKAPLAIYLNGLFTVFLGLEPWVVRLPFVISGIIAVYGAILLGKTLFKETHYPKVLSLILGFSLAVSPWHMHFTRTGFESGLALTMIIWGTYLFLSSWTSKKHFQKRITVSLLLFVASLYTYHSTKIVAPLLGVFLVWDMRQHIQARIKELVLPVVVAGISLLPLLYDLFFRNGLERAGVTIFAQGYTLFESVGIAVRQFLIHFHVDFLLFGETTTLRHGDGVHGVLYPTTFMIVFGVVTWIGYNFLKKNILPKYVVTVATYASMFVVLGILPAAIATEVPHSNRALTASIGFLLLATLGISELLRVAEKHKIVKKLRDSRDRKTIFFQLIVGTYVLLHALFAAEYVSAYFKQYAQDSADAFKDGYIEAFEYVIPYETGSDGTHEVQNIMFTSKYGQPYIYALFTRQTSPIYYHGGSLIKYLFVDEFVEGDLLRDNTIIVTSAEDVMPFEKADHVVTGSDGMPRFYIFDTTTVKW